LTAESGPTDWSPESSSVGAVEHCLARIRVFDDRVHAMMTVLDESALAVAEQRDRDREAGRPLGVLHGMPVIVKDNIDTRGVRTTAGSLHLADHVPTEDAVYLTGSMLCDFTEPEPEPTPEPTPDPTPEPHPSGKCPPGWAKQGRC
jgi:hypothetical protein